MPAARRSKRSNNSKNDTTPTSTAESVEQQPAFSALSPPQFSVVVCISLAFTHFVDLAKSIGSAKDMLHYGRGIIAPENITSIPVNATSYCVRHFRNLTEIQADMDDQDAILEELGCTPSDLSILNVKYQTSILRIALCVVVTMLCWGNQPLLKSWAYAYAIFIMITLGGLMTQSEYLKGSEKFSLIAMLVLILATNRRGRQGRVKLDIDEGLFNLVLFILVVFMSIIISTLGLVVGIEELTTFSVDDVTPGGKALWYMTVVDEYSILMVIGAFALFFFDEGRKRVLLVFMSFVMVYHAFIQLPSQKDFWIDAKSLQSFVMLMVVSFLAGGLIPSFNKFVIKK